MADSAAATWLEAGAVSAVLATGADGVAAGAEAPLEEGFIEELEDELEDGS